MLGHQRRVGAQPVAEGGGGLPDAAAQPGIVKDGAEVLGVHLLLDAQLHRGPAAGWADHVRHLAAVAVHRSALRVRDAPQVPRVNRKSKIELRKWPWGS